ncbi:hypothetical protein [Xylanimonas allomyrinae]|uniref:hypothetical protein n=1 Tax=Xylanimonas allomyrinae TaxID=2509459 RepID=UPI001FE27BC5|nr:hypothetical protein [Xylanimonas allomyrinae]
MLGLVVVLAVAGWLVLRPSGDAPVRERCEATLDGTSWYLSPAQAENAALIAGVSVRRSLPARAATIALATALQESRLINIDYGDRDSLGLFQQRPSQGWGTPEQVLDPLYATDRFYDALVGVPGYQDLDVTVAAQAVQRSGFPGAYAQHETRSRAWASGLTGHSPAVVSCELDPAHGSRTAEEAGAALRERAQRDLGLGADAVVVASAVDGTATVTVDAAALPTGDPVRAAWAVAQWAVATAAATDAVEVRSADMRWTRDGGVRAGRGEAPAWTPGGEPLDAGLVTVRVAVAG